MSQPEWTPANPAERAIADALARGDGAEYARLLRSTPLLVPDLPSPGSEEETDLAEIMPPGFLPVYTSPESMEWALGGLVPGYVEIDFATLLQRWPDPDYQLAVNPGCPIATYLPTHAVRDLAEGRESLASVEAIERTVRDEALAQISRICLRELAGGDLPEPAEPWDDPPANPLERALRSAVERGDGEAYLRALLAGDPVLLPATSAVDDPKRILDEDFPWRVFGRDQARVIPIFSSPAMLARTGTGELPTAEVDFLYLVAAWPGEEYYLLVNPGSVLELLLPGDTVLEVGAALGEGLA